MIDGILLTKFDTIDDKVGNPHELEGILKSNNFDFCILNYIDHDLAYWGGITGIVIIVGWSSTVNGVYIRSTGDVRWMWAVIYRPEETEREIHCEDASEIRVVCRLSL